MEKCQRCGEVDEDRRTLSMACFYDMSELNIPFKQEEIDGVGFYTLRVCKNCRGSWMGSIQKWFDNPDVVHKPGSGIFVRRNGATVEITEEEWYRENPDREPCRVKR